MEFGESHRLGHLSPKGQHMASPLCRIDGKRVFLTPNIAFSNFFTEVMVYVLWNARKERARCTFNETSLAMLSIAYFVKEGKPKIVRLTAEM
jgi:hypothetical protein